MNRPRDLCATRRLALRTLGVALVATPMAKLLGCANNGRVSDVVSDGGAADAGGWATGGTAAMTGSYPDPFAGGIATPCTLTCSATLGPCYAATVARKDISEGHDGLPTRMAFLVVDESCAPVPGAEVDIWHAAPEGVYSGSDAVAMCTLSDPAALAARWFRGKQPTDPYGRVDFDTVFPGWYRGRTVHVHFSVRVGGVEYVTSQLVFADALVDEIVATQPLYSDRGPRDTNNQNDSVISASNAAAYSFEAARMADGAMLASKVLVLRSSLSTALCSLGSGGSEGPGGAP